MSYGELLNHLHCQECGAGTMFDDFDGTILCVFSWYDVTTGETYYCVYCKACLAAYRRRVLMPYLTFNLLSMEDINGEKDKKASQASETADETPD